MSNVSFFTMLTIILLYFFFLPCTYLMYFKSEKELNYDRFVDLNILGAARLVHSDQRIYRISFFLLDVECGYDFTPYSAEILNFSRQNLTSVDSDD